ncbi:hypothetical protein B0J11DRAFT_344366 [Dendryphion nanum]|uniref:Glucose-methanol-choline oxidoreductase N-terminal domain-containing protein n=1 Tax=Dendryphion nanum TaxID=256645 RepID=A0A9P9DNE2_9PLEO|nr:hypothetical protein B0J11DRAFT_344366 [Dendryphion nanum]
MAPILPLLSGLASLALFALTATAAPTNNETYDYIVVGTGPGGGPLAANLGRAGYSVLVLEAGDDQTENVNVSQWFNFNAAGNDPATRWDFFVRHSDDEAREARYLHRTWRKSDGGFYVGIDPPAGAKPLGVYYPRAGTLGGCAMHNGCLTMNPNDLDWNEIAETTGDDSWSAENMRKYLVKLEKTHYNSTYKHGKDGWLDMTMLDPGYTTSADAKQLSELAAQAAGYSKAETPALLARDMNGNQKNRDNLVGPFGGVSHIHPNNRRSSPGYYLRDTVAEKKYPITLSLDTLATKIIFDTKGSKPKAVGIEFLKGKSLYSADPRYNAKDPGTPGKAYARKEVIISGGAFNTPQLLLLSGIGPAKHLKKFDIPVIVDSPGVGQQVADNYEAGIISLAKRALVTGGTIFPAFWKTSVGKIRDIYMWCGSFAFEGFWPGFPNLPPTFTGTYGPNEYECAIVHMNPRSQAGVIELRSKDPRDTPAINLNFFKEKGSDKDLTAILEAVQWVRSWLSKVNPSDPNSLAPFEELHPCKGEIGKAQCSEESQKTYLKEQAYSHHASSSARIGADGDKFAVLDSKFRVRGVSGLRVVDASAFPKVPGGFPVLPTMMLSEKASEILIKGK